MKPRVTWAIVLLFFLGAVLIVGGYRRGFFPICALGSVLAAGAVGMAYRQRWAPWIALSGLAGVMTITVLEMIFGRFSWRSTVGMVGLAFLVADVIRELRAAKREREKPLISLVQFRRAPNNFLTDKKLGEIAQRLWGEQMGADHREEQWFAVGQNPSFIVKAPGMTLLVNNFPSRYFEDEDDPGAEIEELRLRRALEAHTAWLSVDLLSMNDGTVPRDDAYPLVAKFFAELLDDDCLAVYTPETGRILPYEPALVENLRGPDPLAAFSRTTFAPVLQVEENDPRMKAAVDEARQRWPEFLDAFHRHAGEHFAIKAPVTVDDNTEFIWIEVESIRDDTIHGHLANDPVALGGLKLGDAISVPVDRINDWNYIANGKRSGCFTMKVLQEASEARGKA